MVLNEHHKFFNKLFNDYLADSDLSPASIAIYERVIEGFFERGFSVDDLKGAIDRLIEDYSRGGEHYDPKDHGNTVAALKKARDFFRRDVDRHFLIMLNGCYQSFFPVGKYVYSYYITNGVVGITYGKGPLPGDKVTKKLSRKYEDEIFHLLYRYKHLLSKETKPINTFHGPLSHYSYEFLSKKCDSCSKIFTGDDFYLHEAEEANAKLAAIIKKLVK